jgi:hypothetical protein
MKNKEFIELPITLEIRDEDIDSIVDKATEKGGILHWSQNYKYIDNRSIANGGVLLLYDVEGRVHELNIRKLLSGIMQALPYIDWNINSIEPDGADLIIQLGLWNEVVYY